MVKAGWGGGAWEGQGTVLYSKAQWGLFPSSLILLLAGT